MERITTHSAITRFELGKWCVEPAVNCITSAQSQHFLEPRHMAVLLALVRAPERTLTKAQLLDTVWPHRFVVDSVLKRAVWKLRRALGDNARDPRYIQTVYKVGYRLMIEPRPVTQTQGRRLAPTAYNMLDVGRCLACEALCAPFTSL